MFGLGDTNRFVNEHMILKYDIIHCGDRCPSLETGVPTVEIECIEKMRLVNIIAMASQKQRPRAVRGC